MSSSTNKGIVLYLKTSDNKKVEMEAEILKQYSHLVGNMLDSSKIEDMKDKVLPFYNITSETMEQVKLFLTSFNKDAQNIKPISNTNCEFNTVFKDDKFVQSFF